MIIRTGTHADLDEWLRLRQALWSDCPEERHRLEMLEILTNPQTLAIFVAENNSSGLDGFLEASLRKYADGCDTSPVGYIEGWYVERRRRRQGLGGELVRCAEAWARQQGCREMASDCLIRNRTSLAAHLALGYAEAERLIHFRKELNDLG
ncbi:MAG: hypothetical protein B6D39_08390 [Anaerolineae bacterium UTCFX2]|jgi:aminoglycoside 6'-N-acetyltransferase I|nr:GNAT family N-acetyltransferase [Anaerolineae bacterium]MCZ7551965.1 GNAT family N-acetyltransferase [Anaerolineales bacterium]OQY90308.1 MAG: hypothetical protein B6D39_08390 [Anaerolineae bacterium UTCFX2]